MMVGSSWLVLACLAQIPPVLTDAPGPLTVTIRHPLVVSTRLKLSKKPILPPLMYTPLRNGPGSSGEILFHLIISKEGRVSKIVKISADCRVDPTFSEFVRSLQFAPCNPEDKGPWETDFVIAYENRVKNISSKTSIPTQSSRS